MELYERINKLLGTKYNESDHIHWKLLSKEVKMSESFMREFSNRLYWPYISVYQTLSEDFIREFRDNVDWIEISRYQKLSESFIEEFKDKVDWEIISECQELSEDFLRKFSDRVNWNYVSRYQKLSKEFIKEFDLDILYTDENFHYKFKDEIKNIVSKYYSELYDDYFIGYTYCSTKVNNLDVYDYDSDFGTKKCRIYYKDLVHPEYARVVYPAINVRKLKGDESLFCNSLVKKRRNKRD